MSKSLIETGVIVNSDGSYQTWKPSSVDEVGGTMQFWGPLFPGQRLDSLLSADQDTAFTAIASWVRAKISLGDNHSTLSPNACFIGENGSVFFAPENLSNRCLFAEGIEHDRYNCPDLSGISASNMDAAAFCAGVMLYTALAKTHPYPTSDFYQDMREGVFLPVHLALPTLDKELSDLIQTALLLPVKRKNLKSNLSLLSGDKILNNILSILTNKKDLFRTLTGKETEQINKEKENYQLKKNTIIKTFRYVSNNKLFLTGLSAILILGIFLIGSMIKGRLDRPTTKGMEPHSVVTAYYDAYNSLDHVFMDVILMGASKEDVKAAMNLFVVAKVRQAYEPGVTELYITKIGSSEDEGQIFYRADYLFLIPYEPVTIIRSDTITLEQDRRGNWRITEILRASSQ